MRLPSFLAVYRNRRMLTILLLGFSSGPPPALTGATLTGWLTEARLPMAAMTLLGAFASASQNVVVDAYRVESLDQAQFGAGGRRTCWATGWGC